MNHILSLLDNYMHNNADEISKTLADDFRKRRIEKGLTRKQVAERSGVAMSNVARFEQKGLISLRNLISLAKDFVEVGTKNQMKEKECKDIFDEVYQNCGDLLSHPIL